jgi:hypothetical protein
MNCSCCVSDAVLLQVPAAVLRELEPYIALAQGLGRAAIGLVTGCVPGGVPEGLPSCVLHARGGLPIPLNAQFSLISISHVCNACASGCHCNLQVLPGW